MQGKTQLQKTTTLSFRNDALHGGEAVVIGNENFKALEIIRTFKYMMSGHLIMGHRPVHPAPRDCGQKLGAASMSARAGGTAAAEPKLGHGAATESKLGPGSRAIYLPRIVVRMRGYATIRKIK